MGVGCVCCQATELLVGGTTIAWAERSTHMPVGSKLTSLTIAALVYSAAVAPPAVVGLYVYLGFIGDVVTIGPHEVEDHRPTGRTHSKGQRRARRIDPYREPFRQRATDP